MFKKIHVFRVKPDQEVITAIAGYCSSHAINSAVLMGMIGSVKTARINFLKELPGKYESVDYSGPLEIVTAQGTIALKDKERIVHIHMQLSAKKAAVGGHLVLATVFSTAEVVLGELDYQLNRGLDSYTGLNELES